MNTPTILDGGMGQELIARTQRTITSLWSTKVLLEEPELVEDVHDAYFLAGADVATTNSYAIHRDRLRDYDIEDQFESLLLRACSIANKSRDKFGSGMIAGSLGPNARSYRPDLVLSIEEGIELYSEIAGILAPQVDVFLLETMVSLKQATGALIGASAHNKPVWLSITVSDEDGSLLRSGEPISQILTLAKQNNAAAVLVNCSSPEAVTQALKVLSGNELVIGGYANGFTRITDNFKTDYASTVEQLETRKDLDPTTYLKFAQDWRALGAEIIGGCCEVGPEHIKVLAQYFKN